MARLKGKHVVIGLGKTGLSCVRFLKRLGCDVVVIDTRAEPPGKKVLHEHHSDVALLTGDLDQYDLTAVQELVVSPGVSLKTPAIAKAIKAGVSYAGDVELFARSVDAPVIAVTGSNGKSTVVTLIGKALEAVGYNACVAGNIGLPVLDALSAAQQVDVWILELSSFQLETTHSLRAKIAVNLNVTEDHMDRYESLDDYAMAKQRIFEGCDTAVYWLDDHRTKPVHSARGLLPFGGNKAAHGRFYVNTNSQPNTVMDGNKVLLSSDQLLIKGSHNLLNVAACMTVVSEFYGQKYNACLEAIKVFPGLPHRCQWVAKLNGADWFNDSKGTNIGSTVAAIIGLDGSVDGDLIWIAGGEGKGADFTTLNEVLAARVKRAFLYGRDASIIAAAIGQSVAVSQVDSLQYAVEQAKQIVQSGDVVLFSPACASFDQFNNYEERGQQFMQLVKA